MLIIGIPRSGTTLVEQIVFMHPQVVAGGELHFWNERGNEEPFLAKAAADYLRVLRAIAPKAARVTDKMPFNFLWPGRSTWHSRAQPSSIAAGLQSTRRCRSIKFISIRAWQFPTRGADLVAYFRSYQRLMNHWRSVLPADREVDYEDLIRGPEPVMRRIIAACGLSWQNACLRPESNPRAVKTPSKWQTRQPIYRSSVARWRPYEPWLGPARSSTDASIARSWLG